MSIGGIDITPLVAKGRQLVQGYGDGGFRISESRHEGPVLVFPTETRPWPVSDPADITPASLEAVFEAAADIEILVIGCGGRFLAPPVGLREALKDAGIVLEWMDTGAACRTFNVLLTEDRLAAAALIAVD